MKKDNQEIILEDEALIKLKSRKGLRKKFFITVVLPPLIPLLILGVLGFFQLTKVVKNSLIDQLSRASESTAARVERELSIRKTVLKRTGEEIFRTQREFDGKRAVLADQREGCKAAINQTGFGQFTFIGNPSCDPFLDEFARLINLQIRNINQLKAEYNAALERDYQKELSTLNSQENIQINIRFRSFKLFFPETLEIIVVKDGEKPQVAFEPNEQQDKESALKQKASELYKKTIEGDFVTNIIEFHEKRLIIGGYKTESEKTVGGILAAYDADHEKFLKPAWDATPKVHEEDLVFIGDSEGNVVYPKSDKNEQRATILKSAAAGKESSNDDVVYNENDTQMLAQSSNILESNWGVIVASPSDLILKPLEDVQRLTILAILISLLVSLIVGFVFVTSATNAIKNLLSGALNFAKGKLDHKIYLASGDELQTLAETMNEMAAQIKQGQEALVAKSKEFMHITSHELKAPMTGIIGYLSLIVDEGMGKVDREAKGYITQAYQQTIRLRDLVTKLLDVARIEAKRIEYTLTLIDPIKEIKEAISLQKIPAQDKNIQIIYNPAQIPKILADKEKFGIVMTNFISNAIKYNKDGGKIVIAHKIEGDQLVTSVSDEGIGMTKADQEKLFQKFFRTETGKASGALGTGLGLYITKQFIEGMGGKVWLESQEGKGTTFYFTNNLNK